jgi:hypothetical protein
MRSPEVGALLLALAGCAPAPHGPTVMDAATGGAGDLASAGVVDLASPPAPPPPDLSSMPPNAVPIVIDSGPPAAAFSSYNVPFVSVTLCAPGTTTCATIDHVTVDTGSVGLRVLDSALPAAVAAALPAVKAGSGAPLAECYAFADGYTWGSVRTADLTLGGEHVAGLALQLIGDPGLPTVPKACRDTGTAENTLDTFGSNAILGVGNYAPDCGTFCESATQFGSGYPYYGCATAGSCAQVTVASAAQLQNPVALLPVDNNGVVLQLPAIAVSGAADPAGLLLLGIGTQANNALGAATIFPIGDQTTDGTITVTMAGRTFSSGAIDSGTTDISYDDIALPACSGDFAAWDCPPSPLDLTAQNLDGTGGSHPVAFHIEAASTLMAGGTATAFDDIASPAGDKTSFTWGLPFFYGRSVFTAIEGRTTPAGAGPYFAY